MNCRTLAALGIPKNGALHRSCVHARGRKSPSWIANDAMLSADRLLRMLISASTVASGTPETISDDSISKEPSRFKRLVRCNTGLAHMQHYISYRRISHRPKYTLSFPSP